MGWVATTAGCKSWVLEARHGPWFVKRADVRRRWVEV